MKNKSQQAQKKITKGFESKETMHLLKIVLNIDNNHSNNNNNNNNNNNRNIKEC